MYNSGMRFSLGEDIEALRELVVRWVHLVNHDQLQADKFDTSL